MGGAVSNDESLLVVKHTEGVCVLIFFIPWLYLPLACGERAQDPSGRA